MSLRIAFDLDGTVADMASIPHGMAETLFGRNPQSGRRPANAREPQPVDALPASADAPAVLQQVEPNLTQRQQSQLWDHVRKIDNFWTTLPELEPGIIARIAHAASQRKWEVMFLTTRPSTAGEITQMQSQRWLATHGFRYPSVFVVQRSRGKIADALQLDFVVDDRPENCLDVVMESQAKAILVWSGDPADAPTGPTRMGVRAVASISEALAHLEAYDDERKQPGVVRSIKKLLGRAGSR